LKRMYIYLIQLGDSVALSSVLADFLWVLFITKRRVLKYLILLVDLSNSASSLIGFLSCDFQLLTLSAYTLRIDLCADVIT
jgi:hypothetical protein